MSVSHEAVCDGCANPVPIEAQWHAKDCAPRPKRQPFCGACPHCAARFIWRKLKIFRLRLKVRRLERRLAALEG